MMPSRSDTSRRSTAFGLAQRELDKRTSVIVVEGELDLSTAPRLKWALVDALETGHDQLIVDLALTTFMDSTALGVLVGVKRKLVPDGGLAITRVGPEVQKIFESSGMDGAFTIFSTLEEACASMQARTAQAG
jgi:anti-sigma B factor antagonist